MQQLPQDVLQEIARRVNMRNRAALEATSRTMRAAARPVTAEITRETRAGLCRALKIAFGIRRVIQQFADPTIHSRVDSQKQAIQAYISTAKAIQAYISTAKARARPGEGAELTSRVTMDSYDTACYVTGLFGGYINGLRFDVHAIIRGPSFVYFDVQRGGITQTTITVSKGGVTANYDRPETIAIKVISRAIKACATSLRATMW